MKAKKRVVKRKTICARSQLRYRRNCIAILNGRQSRKFAQSANRRAFFIEIGVEVVAQQSQHRDAELQESQECEPCIGFRVDRSDDDED